jgi:hypothetical protein
MLSIIQHSVTIYYVVAMFTTVRSHPCTVPVEIVKFCDNELHYSNLPFFDFLFTRIIRLLLI